MNNIKSTFIDYCLKHNILRFGNFRCKNRYIPYVFDTHLFYSGEGNKVLGYIYIKTLENYNLSPDMLIGIPNKGISVISSIASTYFELYKKDINYGYFTYSKDIVVRDSIDNFLGKTDFNNALLVEDVISSTNRVRETIELIKSFDSNFLGLLVCLDREENSSFKQNINLLKELSNNLEIKTYSIITLTDIIEYMKDIDPETHLSLISYKKRFGLHNKR